MVLKGHKKSVKNPRVDSEAINLTYAINLRGDLATFKS